MFNKNFAGIKKFKIRNKKATIGTTAIWIIGTLIIIVLSFIVLVAVLYLAKSHESEFEKTRVFPEKAGMLYSILSKTTGNKRLDEKIHADGITGKSEILRKIPIPKGKLFKWHIEVQNKEEVNKFIASNYFEPKAIVIFPLMSSEQKDLKKDLNVVLYFEDYGKLPAI